ncbi:MAG: Gfo/Idh/MocA family oxidoreductase [Armatimonadota bacterium]
MQPVRMGFVGAGYMGQLAHIGNYAGLEGCEMLALAEPREELARKVAEEHGIARVYTDHRQLADDPDIDAVAAILPQQLVTPVVHDLLQAGKHVITEKPMGVRTEDCRELAQMAAEHGLVYQVGYMKRNDTGVLLAKRIVEDLLETERLGGITMARAWCFAGEWKFGIEEPITTDEPVPDGVSEVRPFPEWLPDDLHALYNRVLNVDSHATNLVRFLLGEDYEFEQAAYRGMSRPIMLQGWSESGANCVFELGRLPAPRWHEGVEIFFERATLLVEPPPPMRRQSAARVVLREMGEQPRTIEPEAAPGWAFAAQAQQFLASIRGEEQPVSPASDAVRDVELAEQAVRLAVK